MMSFAISLLSLLLSRTAPEPSRRRRNRVGLSRPWRGVSRSLSSGGSTARPRLEALEDRCLPSVTINEFSVGPYHRPDRIEAGPDGSVWFWDASSGNQRDLDRITPAGQIDGIGFPLPEDINTFAFGKDGNVWFGESTHISEATPQGALLHDYDIPSAHNVNGAHLYVALGPDGNIWYVEYGPNQDGPDVIGRLTPAGQITEFPIPFAATEVVTGPDGNLWFDATAEHVIGRITPTGDVAIFNNPDSGLNNGAYRGLTSGPSGNLWMAPEALSGGDVIEEVNTAGQLVATFSDPDGPYLLTPGPDGNIWFTELGSPFSADGGNHIGSITPQGSITEYPIPTLNSEAVGITAGPDGNIWFTEYAAGQIGEVVLNHTSTSVASSLNAPLYDQGVTFTATVSNSGTEAPAGSVEFYDGSTDLGRGTPGSTSGNQATWTLTTSALSLGSHTITAVYSSTNNLVGSQGSATVTVLPPASLSGTVFEDFNNDGQVDFGEKGISGVTITLTGTDDLSNAVSLSQTTDGDGAYVFSNLRPGNYFLTEAQPSGYTQGIDPVGTAGGSLSGTDQFSVALGVGVNGLNYNYGERPTSGGGVQHGQTAGIGFWNNKQGQALIKALNGGAGHQLADWLAATLPNTFGKNAGSNNVAGQSNAAIAALFQQDFVMKGVKLDAQLLATALAVYATNAALDPTKVAASYGFTVSGDGAGTATASVGSNGDAFGVANNTTMTLMDLLLAADAQAVNGVLYGGNAAKRNEANAVFSAVNQAGGIG